jgi:antitoxin component YwqK of YwqJK toxin-antitoxin module
MINYKNILILKLSDLTEWKNKKEMIVPSDLVEEGWCSDYYTCEFFDDRKYTMRGFNGNWEEILKVDYQNNEIHGKYIMRYDNGIKQWEENYKNGVLDGKCAVWFKNGSKNWELEYSNGRLNGMDRYWNYAGVLLYSRKYKDGRIVRTYKG